MKATIVRAEKACRAYCEANGLKMWDDVAICLTIHDELIFQVPIGHSERLAAFMDAPLSDWPQFKIPIVLEYAKVENGSSWAYKQDFELEKVAA
jgi:DNA polymerase I-like protein with 3'-5' exonuclease and polymerase domains